MSLILAASWHSSNKLHTAMLHHQSQHLQRCYLGDNWWTSYLPSLNLTSLALKIFRKSVADWRELALVPRSAKLHDRLNQQTKELPHSEPAECGVVIQADAEHMQYKVMTFGFRRMTIRNRKNLRKFTPVNTPANMPIGLPKNILPSPAPVQKTKQPPAQITTSSTASGSASGSWSDYWACHGITLGCPDTVTTTTLPSPATTPRTCGGSFSGPTQPCSWLHEWRQKAGHHWDPY